MDPHVSWQGGWQQGVPYPNAWQGSSAEMWQGQHHMPLHYHGQPSFMPPQHYHAGPPLHHAMQQPIPVYPPPPHQHHPWEQPVAQVGGYSQPYGRGRGRGRGNSVVAALIATYADPCALTKYDECDPEVVEGLWGPKPADCAGGSGAPSSDTAGTAADTSDQPRPEAHPAQEIEGQDAAACPAPSKKPRLQGSGAPEITGGPESEGPQPMQMTAAAAEGAQPGTDAGLEGIQQPRQLELGVQQEEEEQPQQGVQQEEEQPQQGVQQEEEEQPQQGVQQEEEQPQQGVQQEEEQPSQQQGAQQQQQQDSHQQLEVPEKEGDPSEVGRKRCRREVQEQEVQGEQQQQKQPGCGQQQQQQQQQQHPEEEQQQHKLEQREQLQQQRTEAELEACRARRSLPILLFDLNGTLTSHTSRRKAAGTNHPRPHVALLARLAKKFRLGIYTSSTVRTVAAAKQMLEKIAGCPLFEPHLILYREHTMPALAMHRENGGKEWDTVKPLGKWFGKMDRVLLFDDDEYKALAGEEGNMVLVPAWGNGELEDQGCRVLEALVAAVEEELGGLDADVDVRTVVPRIRQRLLAAAQARKEELEQQQQQQQQQQQEKQEHPVEAEDPNEIDIKGDDDE